MTVVRWILFALAVPVAVSAAPPADVPDGGIAFYPGRLDLDAAGNGVLEPNEIAVVAPIWHVMGGGGGPTSAVGTVSSFSGPAGPVYTILDNAATYGDVSPFELQCAITGDCYRVRVDAATRPATHWDALLVETFMGGWTANWSVHVGGSFTDVPASSGFYRFVETVLHGNVTTGCGPTTYCPTSSTTREQMAVFVLVAKGPPGVSPPACVAGSEMFTDVPASSPFCKWVEELARRGVASGCSPGHYCPSAVVSREQMAVFVLKTRIPTLNPPACGTPLFADVPASNPFCRWIEELVRWGVVSGCGGGNYCPGAAVTREQMSVFLSSTFGLTF